MKLWRLNCGCIAMKDEDGDFVVIKPCDNLDRFLSIIPKESEATVRAMLLDMQDTVQVKRDLRAKRAEGQEAIKRLKAMVQTIDWIKTI